MASEIHDITKRYLQCAFYRWEFIRRSKNYKADIDRFFEHFGGWLTAHGVDMTKLPEYSPQFWLREIQPKLTANTESSAYLDNRIGPFLITLKMKWGTDFPLHPNYTF